MIIASSTSLGMYPKERIAMPSSCLDIKPFPSLSSTRKASRISVKEKEEEKSYYGGGLPWTEPHEMSPLLKETRLGPERSSPCLSVPSPWEQRYCSSLQGDFTKVTR
ncbi:hypothetical protein llap_20216 [Limosa lapponica baueri]|uniref:Uncharacterized protein n=1 Tax=Limosa lapponica baueri TaxID=1758121 RepID=A0A2I0T6R4_LIMLA|nr:hypothetical protein llap_20216 [Limosa lapponica baueri]